MERPEGLQSVRHAPGQPNWLASLHTAARAARSGMPLPVTSAQSSRAGRPSCTRRSKMASFSTTSSNLGLPDLQKTSAVGKRRGDTCMHEAQQATTTAHGFRQLTSGWGARRPMWGRRRCEVSLCRLQRCSELQPQLLQQSRQCPATTARRRSERAKQKVESKQVHAPAHGSERAYTQE